MHFLALLLAAFFAYSLYLLLSGQGADSAAARAHATLREALDSGDEKRDQLLLRCCAECEKVVTRHPRHVFAWHVWAAALWNRGKDESGEQADRLYAQAEEKYACALEIKPDDIKLTVDLFWVLWSRADLYPGFAGLGYLERICDECERLLVLKPDEAVLLNFWGSALSCRGTRTSPEEADRLLALAEEKLSAALTLVPGDQGILNLLGNVLWRRAKLHRGEAARDYLMQSDRWLESALRAKPADARALSARAWVLFLRAKLLPGEETNRLLAEAVRQFETAAGDDADTVRQGWGVVLWAQARSAEGEESTRLLQAAREKLAEAESHAPASAAYNLACVCAQLGDQLECRQWLEKSREPGVLVSREQMATEEELASVRECEWFRAMLG